jgi:hypothetical protein
LNDLKKFAQQFQLHTEVPADLLPILARDEAKQREIEAKAARNIDHPVEKPASSNDKSAAEDVLAPTAEVEPITQIIGTSENEQRPLNIPLDTGHDRMLSQVDLPSLVPIQQPLPASHSEATIAVQHRPASLTQPSSQAANKPRKKKARKKRNQGTTS